MGRFVNPGNGAFQVALNSEIYVDKTGLLEYTNRVLNTTQKFICNSRPRRFGKSITVDMLTAYYGKGCDSTDMFRELEIGKSECFREHLNRYDVIHLDVQWCMMDAGTPEDTVDYINEHLIDELHEAYPQVTLGNVKTAYGAMSMINTAVGSRFIVIIDEWDVLIRDEAAKQHVLDEYINFLRGMFKGSEPTKFIQLAYLTGILPIKKVRTQSALNNFDEFSMLEAGNLAPYTGFTESEVKNLCIKYNRNFEDVRRWYDGYLLEDYQIYNPRAVVSVMMKDLGYLGYDQNSQTAFIPNEEIRQELTAATESRKWNELITFQQESSALLDATLDMDSDLVAEEIEKIHNEYASAIQYNNENSLSSVITVGYLSAMQYYFKPIRELPTGRGFADFVFIPKTEYMNNYPVLIVELKWNRNVKTALQQIRNKKYPESMEQYYGDILLIGISYDKKTKKHQCMIEKYEKK